MVVASSVRVAGVLLVFSYLIVPALAGHRRRRARVAPGSSSDGAFGTGVSVLGMLASALLDLPTGATVACMFGLVLLLWPGLLRARRLGRVAEAPALHSV